MGIIPRLDKSLCGCSVETGSMIIAWVGMISISLQLLMAVFFMSIGDEALKTKNNKDDNPELSEETLSHAKIVLAIVVAIVLFLLVINLLLLVGLYKKNVCLMAPWVILGRFTYYMSIVSAVIYLFYSIVNPAMLLNAILHIMSMGLGAYCFFIVNSHYLDLEEGKTHE